MGCGTGFASHRLNQPRLVPGWRGFGDCTGTRTLGQIHRTGTRTLFDSPYGYPYLQKTRSLKTEREAKTYVTSGHASSSKATATPKPRHMQRAW